MALRPYIAREGAYPRCWSWDRHCLADDGTALLGRSGRSVGSGRRCSQGRCDELRLLSLR